MSKEFSTVKEEGQEYLGILPDEETPIIIEIEQVKCFGFANKAQGRFRIVQGPRYVWAHIFGDDGWQAPQDLPSIVNSLVSNGHSFKIATVKKEVSPLEYQSYSDFESERAGFYGI